jgi:hypothetical protein
MINYSEKLDDTFFSDPHEIRNEIQGGGKTWHGPGLVEDLGRWNEITAVYHLPRIVPSWQLGSYMEKNAEDIATDLKNGWSDVPRDAEYIEYSVVGTDVYFIFQEAL